ncbi:MAG: DUF1292 domain-containing protein [Firmicutes bacterium]|nr:DUF1292 domain-containing protein [Bacillota bacterium]
MMINKENNTIILSGDDGQKKEYKVILTFEVEENDNFYIVYTDNVVDEDGYLKTYAGIYQNIDGKESLLPVVKDEEWDLIEKLLAKVDRENGA